MSFFRVNSDAPNHPKIAVLRRLYGSSGFGSLVILWAWVSQNRPDGDLRGLEDDQIEAIAAWEKTPGAFVICLKNQKLLDGDSGHLRVHNWKALQGYFAQQAENKAHAARQRRYKKRHLLTVLASPADAKMTPRLDQIRLDQKDQSLSVKKRPRRSLSAADLEGFETFWQAYPRKTAKGAAEKAWEKVNGDGPAIMAALVWQKDSPQHLSKEPQYIPHPATWLNQRRWEDPQPEPYDPGDF